MDIGMGTLYGIGIFALTSWHTCTCSVLCVFHGEGVKGSVTWQEDVLPLVGWLGGPVECGRDLLLLGHWEGAIQVWGQRALVSVSIAMVSCDRTVRKGMYIYKLLSQKLMVVDVKKEVTGCVLNYKQPFLSRLSLVYPSAQCAPSKHYVHVLCHAPNKLSNTLHHSTHGHVQGVPTMKENSIKSSS